MRALLVGLTMGIMIMPMRYVNVFTVDRVMDSDVYLTDRAGEEFIWEQEEGEQYEKGDRAVAIMFSKGTQTKEDDEIYKLVRVK